MFTPLSLARVRWVLRVVLAVQCAGVAIKLLWGTYETEADVYGLLMFDLQWPEETALRVEDAGTLAYFAAGMIVLLAPLFSVVVRSANQRSENKAISVFSRILLWLQATCLIWIALWQSTLSTLHTFRGGSFMAEWAVAAHAVRIMAPLALLTLLTAKGVPGERRAQVGDWMLRIATAATFITHGFEAIWQNPAFLDLIIGSAHNLLGLSLTESTAAVLLVVIGVIDIALAALLLFVRWRWVTGYLAFWGFVTALSRITAAGVVGFTMAYPESLIRAANGGAPLAVCIMVYAVATNRGESSQATSNRSTSTTEAHDHED